MHILYKYKQKIYIFKKSSLLKSDDKPLYLHFFVIFLLFITIFKQIFYTMHQIIRNSLFWALKYRFIVL